MRMVRLSGQQGVPVISLNDQVVVGFDRRRLEQLLSQAPASGIRLGAAVADALPRTQLEGAYVGKIKRGSPAESAGLKSGDVITALGGQPVHKAADLERIAGGLQPGARLSLMYLRAGQPMQTELVV